MCRSAEVFSCIGSRPIIRSRQTSPPSRNAYRVRAPLPRRGINDTIIRASSRLRGIERMFLPRRRFTAHKHRRALKNTAVKVNRQRRADRSLWPPFLPPRAFYLAPFFPSLRDARGPSNLVSFAFSLPTPLFFSPPFFLLSSFLFFPNVIQPRSGFEVGQAAI